MSFGDFELLEVTEDMINQSIASMKMYSASVERESDEKHPYKATLQSYGLAIEALSKQLSQKPMQTLGIYGERVYDCKYCGEDLPFAWQRYNYCPHCGQKIDWSEVGPCKTIEELRMKSTAD